MSRAQQTIAVSPELPRRTLEDRYRLIAENARDVIATADIGGVLTYVSPSAEEVLGYAPDEMVGRNWADFMHPDDVARLAADPPGPDALRVTFRVRRADGIWVWIESFARIITDPDTGAPIEFQTAARDISDRVAAEDALRRQIELHEAMLRAQSDLGEGCLIAEEGRVVYANDAYCRLTGYSREELAAIRSLLDLATPKAREELAERQRARRRGENVPDQYETEMVRKDGARIDLEVSHRIVELEGTTRYVTIVRDITERKFAENQLRESERRFAELYERERDAAERLRALDDMKNAFLAAVSHELRTPLTSVLGLASALEVADARMSSSERIDIAARIVKNAEKLNDLLVDLLDLDRARRGLLEPRRARIDVGALARTTAEEWTAASGRMVRVSGTSVEARLDAPKVERIIENLLANAGKHTREGTPIWLHVSHAEAGVLITVDDEGLGVRDELKQAIFEPFVRGSDSPKHAPGTGIGLSLVWQFASLHGGRAWVEDRPGGGASFKVYLPDGPVSSAERHPV